MNIFMDLSLTVEVGQAEKPGCNVFTWGSYCVYVFVFAPFPFSLSISFCLCCQAGKSPPQNIILLTFQLALSSCLDLFDSWRVGDRLDFPDYFIIDIEKVQELGIVSFPQPD